MKHAALFALAVAAAVTSACSPKPSPPASAAIAPKPVASVQEIMLNGVAPASEAIWNAVSTTSDETGVHEERPEDDHDWQKLRESALVLVETPVLLAMERPVMHAGPALHDQDPTVKGPEVSARIAADRAGFAGAAVSMQGVGARLLKAIDARNVEQLVELGGELDAACEACHQVFWYPDDAKAGAAAPAGTGG